MPYQATPTQCTVPTWRIKQLKTLARTVRAADAGLTEALDDLAEARAGRRHFALSYHEGRADNALRRLREAATSLADWSDSAARTSKEKRPHGAVTPATPVVSTPIAREASREKGHGLMPAA